jgi:hypothetical protein
VVVVVAVLVLVFSAGHGCLPDEEEEEEEVRHLCALGPAWRASQGAPRRSGQHRQTACGAAACGGTTAEAAGERAWTVG